MQNQDKPPTSKKQKYNQDDNDGDAVVASSALDDADKVFNYS